MPQRGLEAPTSAIEDERRAALAHMKPRKYSDEDIPHLREELYKKYEHHMRGVVPKMPPLREVNHRIPLIDEGMHYTYHLPRCPDSLKPQLAEKIQLYMKAGWWERASVSQAAPMLCIPKKNGKLRTVVDCRKRNDNTVKDVTPFPDQDQIRMDVAQAKYRSKIDLSNAYEQVRIDPDDVLKTAFSTVFGTFLSHVMQQGDCNAPATFQRLITVTLQEYIARIVHAYLDDTFVYSNTIEEHVEHVSLVLDALVKADFYLERDKVDLFAEKLDCLGHIIDDRGVHVDEDKMAHICNWRKPMNLNEVQRFVGLVEYLAPFLPDVSTYMTPLTGIQRNSHPFLWCEIHDRCFQAIKDLACKYPVLRPIDPRSDEPIWLVCDVSLYGIGALYGQGLTWQGCQPAGFMSKKLTDTQHNYRTFERETLAILEALLKQEDKLLGFHFKVIMDHEALQFLRTQQCLSSRQMRWMDYLSRFDTEIIYIKGTENKETVEWATADIRLDPEGDDLPIDRLRELHLAAMRDEMPKIREPVEERRVETDVLREHAEQRREEPTCTPMSEDPTLLDSAGDPQTLVTHFQGERGFLNCVRQGYPTDPVLAKVILHPDHHKGFDVEDGLVYLKATTGDRVLCLPRVDWRNDRLTVQVIEHAHKTLSHFGALCTGDYIRRHFWWPGMGKDVDRFCRSCPVCQTTKTDNTRLAGLLHSLLIPKRPWNSIAMDFVGPFPESNGADYLWVVLCRLTSMVHLVPVNTTIRASKLAWVFVREIVKLHGLPDTIVSNHDTKFTSQFWHEVHQLLNVRLLTSMAFHPQTDGASEQAIRNVSQILQGLVAPDQRDWAEKLPMVEFAINSSINSSTGFTPFELTYGYLPRSLPNVEEQSIMTAPGVTSFVRRARENLAMAHNAIIEACMVQTHHANKRQREGGKYTEGDLVYLSTKNLTLPKGCARKLLPKYIGPMKVIHANPSTDTYTLELPKQLQERRIHPTFHANLLRHHEPNDDAMFPKRDAHVFYDVGVPNDAEWLVDEINAHRWVGCQLEFLVKWSLGDSTWEPYLHCKELEALDRYLELHRVDDHHRLPKCSRRTTEANA
ncbi:hypothetical protein PISMIDRAFT_17126 [Pisolithus microcarpus 441]|uniref:Unplaced genomic scaffold scaffold_243, whole genome shotgun sequence n=1 Tax=Pisolithus microcarpus 441 TaxID=765257 RepID=A0A0C9Z3Q8_9AGAM|nr:hypothetical protein PISMIDRAFT_17126 [Pisolithus microcarpus 441]